MSFHVVGSGCLTGIDKGYEGCCLIKKHPMKGVRGGGDGGGVDAVATAPLLATTVDRHQVYLVFPNVPIRVRSTQGVNKIKLKSRPKFIPTVTYARYQDSGDLGNLHRTLFCFLSLFLKGGVFQEL